jgi:hypothetical protein
MTGRKIKLEDRWKRRTPPKHSVALAPPMAPEAPVAAPAPAPAPIVDEARARLDQLRVDKWIRDRLIDWPPESCLHCRKPIIVGQLWIVVSNGDCAARFHEPCHAEWLEQQEAAARKAMGLAA